MPETNQVVVRFLNGERLKGTTQDFFPDRPLFHVIVKGRPPAVAVKMSELKAVFFVRDFLGRPAHVKARKFGPMDPGLQTGKRVAVLFKDGELLVGYSLSYVAGKQGFFLTPADRMGNNVRVYVLSHAAKEIKAGPSADELVVRAPQPKPRPRAA